MESKFRQSESVISVPPTICGGSRASRPLETVVRRVGGPEHGPRRFERQQGIEISRVGGLSATILLSRESITGRDVARLQPTLKPLSALRGRTMREAFRAYTPARHPLQAIIADSSGCIEALRNVSLIHNVPLFSRVSPHTGEAIGLQLDSDRKLVARAGVLFLKAADLRFDPEQALNMMANFMRNHVRLREFSGRAKAVFEFLEKA